MATKIDPPKICTNPSCGKVYSRKSGETRQNYKNRLTCGDEACVKAATVIKLTGVSRKGQTRAYETVFKIPEGDIACANCHYVKENSEFGRHCGPCHDGSEFSRIARTAKRRATSLSV